ncbi:MAG TPA: fused MFS/spermidine synthase [Ktedonobacterales bacterium]|nr:fused MFS/spermidine synthase [Ktedonobacterales bacterium]
MRLPFGLSKSAEVAAPEAAATTRAGRDRAALMILVFIGGMASLALEMLGPRLMAPFFGTSLFIWANQIGFTLIYLSIGYYIGGRVADRWPDPRLLSSITAVAALFTGLIPFISKPVLYLAAVALNSEIPNIFVGSLFAVVLLFSVPTILLGMVSPFAIRLTIDTVGSAGRSAGNLYSLSTVGSIIGAFLPVLLLIPYQGVQRSFFIISAVLLAVSLWGLRPRARIAAAIPGALLLVPLLAPQLIALGPLKTVSGIGYGQIVFQQESLYNYIQVVRDTDGTMDLVLNEGHAIHSVYNPTRVLNGPTWYSDYALAAPFFSGASTVNMRPRLAIVGLAAGTVAKQYTNVFGPTRIDGVEIDPDIVAVGRKYFAMNEPNLHVTVADGRTYMRFSKSTYDVVALDAYRPPYIPFQLTTKEFFQETRARMAPDGVLFVNAAHVGHDYRLVQAFVNTISQVFPSVYTLDVPSGAALSNTLIFATARPTTLAGIQARLAQAPAGTALSEVAFETAPLLKTAHAESGGIVFTDDEAPVEQITDQLIIDYIRG